ncbi:hypothetical protein [Allobranchiibius huperziae]|uniref:Uncharacterized protein n=1 Tax=Allobranchiibius huperziae TaxID=1874116 RepID=A0A853DG88_9MICO|nr:hypothetical protein [Allobranchiibius huperziae]NYJ75808.1 hypothetical protein [Allobranchiibius huperziae]
MSVEATPYRCPSCNEQAVSRVLTPVRSFGTNDPTAHTDQYMCNNGTNHIPFGWTPDSKG